MIIALNVLICKDVGMFQHQFHRTNSRLFTEQNIFCTVQMKEISRRDQLSHRNTNVIYMMSTGFSIDIKNSAERCKETRSQRERAAVGERREMEGEKDGERI